MLEEKLSPLWHASFHVVFYPAVKSLMSALAGTIKGLCHRELSLKFHSAVNVKLYVKINVKLSVNLYEVDYFV